MYSPRMASFPALAARIDPKLAAEVRALAEEVRAAPDPLLLRKRGAEAVVKLTDAGLEAFFLKPVQELGLGTMASSMVRVGIGSASTAIAMFIRRLVGGLSAEQMLALADSVDATLLDLELEDDEEN